MKTKLNFNTIGLFTTDNKSMVAFYRDVMGLTTYRNGEDPEDNLIEIHSFTKD